MECLAVFRPLSFIDLEQARVEDQPVGLSIVPVQGQYDRTLHAQAFKQDVEVQIEMLHGYLLGIGKGMNVFGNDHGGCGLGPLAGPENE